MEHLTMIWFAAFLVMGTLLLMGTKENRSLQRQLNNYQQFLFNRQLERGVLDLSVRMARMHLKELFPMKIRTGRPL